MSETIRLDPTEYEVRDADPSVDDESVHNITTLDPSNPSGIQAEFLSQPIITEEEQREPDNSGTARSHGYFLSEDYQEYQPTPTINERVAATVGRTALFDALESIVGPAPTLDEITQEQAAKVDEKQPPSEDELMKGLEKDLTVDVAEKDQVRSLDELQRYDIAERLYGTLEKIPGGQEKLAELEMFLTDKQAIERNPMAWANELDWMKQAQAAIIDLLGGLPSMQNKQLIVDTVPAYYAYNKNNADGNTNRISRSTVRVGNAGSKASANFRIAA